MHERVVNVRAPGARWDVYVGRGRCPCDLRPCPHATRVRSGPLLRVVDWSNPHKLADHGPEAMRRYLDGLVVNESGFDIRALARDFLPGLVLGCWCAGRYPTCHGEVLARLADGDELENIRADVLAVVGLTKGGPRG